MANIQLAPRMGGKMAITIKEALVGMASKEYMVVLHPEDLPTFLERIMELDFALYQVQPYHYVAAIDCNGATLTHDIWSSGFSKPGESILAEYKAPKLSIKIEPYESPEIWFSRWGFRWW